MVSARVFFEACFVHNNFSFLYFAGIFNKTIIYIIYRIDIVNFVTNNREIHAVTIKNYEGEYCLISYREGLGTSL